MNNPPTSDLFPSSRYKQMWMDEVEKNIALEKMINNQADTMRLRSLRINLSLEKDKSEALRQELFNAESKIEELKARIVNLEYIVQRSEMSREALTQANERMEKAIHKIRQIASGELHDDIMEAVLTISEVCEDTLNTLSSENAKKEGL